MSRSKIRAAVLLFSGLLTLTPPQSASAAIGDAVSLGGLSFYLDKYYNEEKEDTKETLLLSNLSLVIPDNIAIAKVNDSCNIRAGAGTNFERVGILTKNAACTVLSVENGWAHIKSGSIVGYISTDYLYLGEQGVQKAREVAKKTARVNAGKVNVRSTPNTQTDDNIIAEVTRDEELEVIEVNSKELLTKNDPNAEAWIKVIIDNEEGYVARQFVEVSYTFKYASKPPATAKTSLRNSIVEEARRHLGLKYVWGGESLTNGADCSGFVRAVYKKCGVNITNLSRTSYDMAKQSFGKNVSLANAQPGDLVFYGDTRGNINHVAMYIGNGQVIHESGRTSGCKISNVNYRTIIKIRNFLD